MLAWDNTQNKNYKTVEVLTKTLNCDSKRTYNFDFLSILALAPTSILTIFIFTLNMYVFPVPSFDKIWPSVNNFTL
jgi:hypothetical protein